VVPGMNERRYGKIINILRYSPIIGQIRL
jgi:hypothetical protein